MIGFKKISRYMLLGSFVVLVGMTGCTKKPTQEELTKLEEAREAAESAEKKLAELRSERMALEETLGQKESELSEHEAERDDLKQKMEERNAK